MSRQVRYRVTALALGGLLLGGPLLANGRANAEQTPGDGRQVVFSGGDVLGLSCRSRPSVESMTVPSDSTVRIVNQTGHNALLRLGGSVRGTLGDGGASEVVFRRGTTAVLLSPDCALGDESTPLLVTAVPSDPATMPDPVPAQSGQADVPTVPADSGSPSASAPGPAFPDAVPPAGESESPSQAGVPGTVTTTDARQSAAMVAATATEAMPPGGSAPKFDPQTGRGTSNASGSPFSGMPPGEHKTLLSAVPSIGLSQVTEPAAEHTQPAPPNAAAEPVATIRPLPDSGRIGLLALIASVCVVGVAAGAIRAFVSQRASKTKAA